MAKCSFCGSAIKPATGSLFVKKDGTALFFCGRKCEKNMLKLKRNPIKVKWTEKFRAFRGTEKSNKKVSDEK